MTDHEIPGGPLPPGPRFPIPAESAVNGGSLFPPDSRFRPNREAPPLFSKACLSIEMHPLETAHDRDHPQMPSPLTAAALSPLRKS